MKTTRTGLFLICLTGSVWGLAARASAQQRTTYPVSVDEYKAMSTRDRNRWPDIRIVQYNLARAHNPELPEVERVASLELVDQIAALIPGMVDDVAMKDLADLLGKKDCPKGLFRELLRFLMKQNYPGVLPLITDLLPTLEKEDPPLYEDVLAYTKTFPNTDMLTMLTQAWARQGAQKNLTPAQDQGYKSRIETLTNKTWDAALLDAINAPSFEARGEAVEILAGRLSAAVLRNRILAVTAKADGMAAMQHFLERHDYLPVTREQFITTAILHNARRRMLSDAARQSLDWSRNYQYRFDIRDFHLLSRLACDPLRSNLSRTQLVLDMGKTLKTRPHVQHTPAETDGPDDYKESFWLQVDALSMADLWNLYLLNEMLSRPAVQRNLRIMAGGPKQQWAGLVFYKYGQAETILYPPRKTSRPGASKSFEPSDEFLNDGRDALCRFVTHFEKENNTEQAGPSAEELADAKVGNFYGLILTRVGGDAFCAHYYNPEGIVISLGKFPLR
jgi:hypothetical protein